MSIKIPNSLLFSSLFSRMVAYLRMHKIGSSKHHTSLMIYDEAEYEKFLEILRNEQTRHEKITPSHFMYAIMHHIIENYEGGEKGLLKWINHDGLPDIDTPVPKYLEYLMSQPMEKVKQYEWTFMQIYTYCKAITQGEQDFSSIDFLVRKYL